MTQSLHFPHKHPYPCNYALFLGAVFDKDPNDILIAWGRRPRTCPDCGKALHPNHQGIFCNKACRLHYDWALAWVEVACDECRRLFYRRAKDLVNRLGKRGYEHVFCSRQCQGRSFGHTHGFAAHPENIPKGLRAIRARQTPPTSL